VIRRLRGLLITDPAIVLETMFFGTISILTSFFDPKGLIQARIARIWAKYVLILSGIEVVVEGLEQIDPNKSYVFVSNHASYMDTPVALANIHVQFRFLAKQGLFQVPFLGQHLSSTGHIPVPRDDPRAAVKTMQIAAETIREKKTSLLIFPEGGRTEDGKLQPFKEGGAYIAIRAGVPCVPVAMIGTHEVLPYGGAVIQSGRVILRVLKPIETSQLTLKDRGPLTDTLYQLIASELGEQTDLAGIQNQKRQPNAAA